MSKRVHFGDTVDIKVHDVEEPKEKISRNTLDSDEELEEEGGVLDKEEIEGEEDGTIEFEEDITFTPFNMNEELEEGRFDREGTYIFNKSKEIRDNWLDNIDWVKVHRKTDGTDDKTGEGDESDDSDSPFVNSEVERDAYYREMLQFMKPGEKVLGAIKRLGASGASASQRWGKKKKGQTGAVKESTEQNEAHMQELTGLADRLLQGGEVDAYGQTFEQITFRLEMASRREESGSKRPAMDMFAEESSSKRPALDMFDEKAVVPDSGGQQDTPSGEAQPNDINEVNWQLRRGDAEEGPIEGPYSSQKMADWMETGGEEVDSIFVRKDGTQGAFYPARRIDFDLYT